MDKDNGSRRSEKPSGWRGEVYEKGYPASGSAYDRDDSPVPSKSAREHQERDADPTPVRERR